jgi:hypothetical protein
MPTEEKTQLIGSDLPPTYTEVIDEEPIFTISSTQPLNDNPITIQPTSHISVQRISQRRHPDSDIINMVYNQEYIPPPQKTIIITHCDQNHDNMNSVKGDICLGITLGICLECMCRAFLEGMLRSCI